jgi:TetR/AcrR family transcriptional regulator, transcriptional repressor for nem operon
MGKGADTRIRILDTAQEIVLRRGFSGTSIDEIIAAAGITKGGFFYHFRGKADLARALMERYLAEDEAFFTALIERADELVDDPLQRALVFLKLFAEAMRDLPGVHPGCLVASFTYESQQFDPAVREMAAAGVQRWRDIFVERFAPVVAKYPMVRKVELEDLADTLTAAIEGGIILSRVMNDPELLVRQLLQFRSHLRLLFGDVES